MGTLSAKMTLKDGYGFGGFSLAPPSKQHLSTPPPPPPPGSKHYYLHHFTLHFQSFLLSGSCELHVSVLCCYKLRRCLFHCFPCKFIDLMYLPFIVIQCTFIMIVNVFMPGPYWKPTFVEWATLVKYCE